MDFPKSFDNVDEISHKHLQTSDKITWPIHKHLTVWSTVDCASIYRSHMLSVKVKRTSVHSVCISYAQLDNLANPLHLLIVNLYVFKQ